MMKTNKLFMKNFSKPGVTALFGIIAITAVFVLSLSGCMSMLMGIAVNEAKKQITDYGAFDPSIPEDQQSVLKFMDINMRSFNGKPVSWGREANNMGYVRVPSGENTFVFNYNSQSTKLESIHRVSNARIYTYSRTTTSVTGITFTDVTMLPGHKYMITMYEAADGDGFVTRLYDVTSMLDGFLGDDVADAPKESKTPTEFEGTWENIEGELYQFAGNTWIQTMPPMTGSNEGEEEVIMRGTFEAANGTMTMYVTGVKAGGLNMWLDMKAMKQAYIYKYSLRGNVLALELPWVLPESSYVKR